MKRISPSSLHKNDAVLVEANIHRYHVVDKETKNARGKEWKYWKTHFQLVSVAKLLVAPEKDGPASDGEDVDF